MDNKEQVQIIDLTFSNAEVKSNTIAERNIKLRFLPSMVKARIITAPDPTNYHLGISCDFIYDNYLAVYSYGEPVNNTGSWRELSVRTPESRVKFWFYEFDHSSGASTAGAGHFPVDTILTISLEFRS